MTVCLNRVITPVSSKGKRRLKKQVTVIIGRRVQIDDSTGGAFCVAEEVGRVNSRDQRHQEQASRKERNQNANHSKPVSDHLRLDASFVGERLRSAGGDGESTTSKRPTSPLGCIVWFPAICPGPGDDIERGRRSPQ